MLRTFYASQNPNLFRLDLPNLVLQVPGIDESDVSVSVLRSDLCERCVCVCMLRPGSEVSYRSCS